ncbi:MAG: cytochrome c maturation protein CcmE [Candidatus Methanoperedens sp.]|nr:cytochrome c maturation protein CcmE [Candidatus Methanoperedens sp.]
MNKKTRLLFGVSIIVVLLGYMGYMQLTADSSQFEVSGALAAKDTIGDKPITVNGTLVSGTDKWDPATKTLTFKMTDGFATMDVVYIGDKPNMPAEAVSIQTIVTGQFNKNEFQAFRMLTKCPSTYEGNNLVDTSNAASQ